MGSQAYEWLAFGINTGAVKRMTRDNFYIIRHVFLECLELRSLARRLTADNGTQFGRFALVKQQYLGKAIYNDIHGP